MFDMDSKVIVLLCFVCGVLCKIDFGEIQKALDKNLKYLEDRKIDVGMLAWGANELECAIVNTPKIPAPRLELVNAFEKRFFPFIKKSGERIKSPFFKEFITNPQYWHSEDEYKHRPGRLTDVKGPAQTLEGIVKKTASTKESDECIMKLFDENKGSVTPRVCKQPCKEKVWDTAKLDNGFPLDERVGYIVFQTLLNCTNDNIEVRTKAVIAYCSQIKADVDAMDKMVADPKFENGRFYYLFKILYCGTYGFPEFFPDDRVNGLLKMINPDGSVGGKSLKPEEVNIQTAMMADTMAGIIRLLTEKGE